ncbi:MAG TPA: copper-containing nitrite reductase [Symbiobacteriaceae bacterium]|nr:copper-containing nitrite reductase [Symbiobacteriaceae bacterium]
MNKTKLSRISLALTVASVLPLAAACSKPPVEAATPAPTPTPVAEPAPKDTTKPAAANAVSIVKNASELPGPITRKEAEKVVVNLETVEVDGQLADGTTYTYWTFNGTVPGPMVRVREGDTVELHLKNSPKSKNAHSIDLHAVNGPGGGAVATQVAPGEEKVFTFKALNPGVYAYHCGTAHIPTHIAQGMYGMIVVEPKEGLAQVDREFYVMQGELYAAGQRGAKGHVAYDSGKMINEQPSYVVFNGKPAGLMGDQAMKAKVGERIRLFVGNGGPNLVSSFHVIGEIFDKLYAEGATDPQNNVQTTLIPSGGAAWMEFTVDVPGTYLLVDHSITRAIDKGAVGAIVVEGDENKEIFDAQHIDTAGH